MNGPSKYDDFARAICASLQAEAVIVVVSGGTLGNGAARAEKAAQSPAAYFHRCNLLATVLRRLADDVERQLTEPDQGWSAVIKP